MGSRLFPPLCPSLPFPTPAFLTNPSPLPTLPSSSLVPTPLHSVNYSSKPATPPHESSRAALPAPYPQSCCLLAPGNASTLGWLGHHHYRRSRGVGGTHETEGSLGTPGTMEMTHTVLHPTHTPAPSRHFKEVSKKQCFRRLLGEIQGDRKRKEQGKNS